MKFLIAYAGIPEEIYEGVFLARRSIVLGDGEFIGKPLRRGFSVCGDIYSKYFLSEMVNRIKNDQHNALKNTSFAVICVRQNEEDIKSFVQRFFPSILVVVVDWKMLRGSPMQEGISTNQLISLLTSTTKAVKPALEAIRKEVVERSNKTPLLLPIRNFKSRYLTNKLQQLQNNLSSCEEHTEKIREYIHEIEQVHPIHCDDRNKSRFFIDEREVWFRAPGRDRHAFSRPKKGHLDTCILSGYRRLGVAYDPAFHYDCTNKFGKGKLKGEFFTCHGDLAKSMEGNPHLNIAPNDFVRA